MARSERFELPALGIEIRCSIQLSYERINVFNKLEQKSQFPGTVQLLKTGVENSLDGSDYQTWPVRAIPPSGVRAANLSIRNKSEKRDFPYRATLLSGA